MARLSVPERYRGPLKELVALDDKALAELRDALNRTPPAQSYNALAARVASIVDQPSKLVLDLVGLLASLARSAYTAGSNLQEAASDAASSARDSDLISGDDSTVLEERLAALLTTKAISVSSKALWLATQQRHVFVRCATFTDIRTVFSSADDEGPLKADSAVVVHSLEIEFHRGSEHLSEFFALDGNDLRTLQATIERAIAKEEELRQLIEKAGIQYIPVG